MKNFHKSLVYKDYYCNDRYNAIWWITRLKWNETCDEWGIWIYYYSLELGAEL